MVTPDYEVKPAAETVWAAVALAVTSVVGWALLTTSMEASVVVPVAAAAGVLVRPIGGYILAWLPSPPKKPVTTSNGAPQP